MQFRTATILLLCALVPSFTSCGSSTGPEGQEPDGPPWEYPDSAYKVIENLEYAYETMDLELYMSCFRYDFEFTGCVQPEPTTWGYVTEGLVHDCMFDIVYDVDLAFEGSGESPWSGDSTGESLELERIFDLNVYMDEYSGFRASGQEIFICRPDGDGTWYVWKWFDYSDTKERMTWCGIKQQFMGDRPGVR